jgi:hypothetical protein
MAQLRGPPFAEENNTGQFCVPRLGESETRLATVREASSSSQFVQLRAFEGGIHSHSVPIRRESAGVAS